MLFTILLCGFGIPQSTTTLGSVSECVVDLERADRVHARTTRRLPPRRPACCPGDQLVSIDGIAVTSWNQATAIIRDSAGEETRRSSSIRDGEELTLPVTPLLTERTVVDDRGVAGRRMSAATP